MTRRSRVFPSTSCLVIVEMVIVCSVAKHINEVQRLTDALGDELASNMVDFFVGCHIGTALCQCRQCMIAADRLAVHVDVVLSKPVREKGQSVAFEPHVRLHDHCSASCTSLLPQACEIFVFEDRVVLCELSRCRAADQPIVKKGSKAPLPQLAPPSMTKEFKVRTLQK